MTYGGATTGNAAYGSLDVPGLTTTGVVTLTGSGDLEASGTQTIVTSATLSGSGDLTATGTQTITGAATLAGSGDLTASATQTIVEGATLAGGADLAAAGTQTVTGSVSFAGGGDLQVLLTDQRIRLTFRPWDVAASRTRDRALGFDRTRDYKID